MEGGLKGRTISVADLATFGDRIGRMCDRALRESKRQARFYEGKKKSLHFSKK